MTQHDSQFVTGEVLEVHPPTVAFTLDPSNEDGSFEPIAPLHGSDTAAGFDMYAAKDTIIRPKSSVLVHTGVRMAIPVGWFGMISPRSSVASKTPLRIGARVIDSDYRGEVLVNIINDGPVGSAPWTVKKGERIAQIIFMQHISQMQQVDSLEDTARGAGGFGSTGV